MCGSEAHGWVMMLRQADDLVAWLQFQEKTEPNLHIQASNRCPATHGTSHSPSSGGGGGGGCGGAGGLGGRGGEGGGKGGCGGLGALAADISRGGGAMNLEARVHTRNRKCE